MKSRWVEGDAEALVAQGAKSGIDRELALRVYTSRLLGRDPKLVLHGGGNTSVKTASTTFLTRRPRCFASRAAAGTWRRSSPPGLPAVRLAPAAQVARARDLVGRGDGAASSAPI